MPAEEKVTVQNFSLQPRASELTENSWHETPEPDQRRGAVTLSPVYLTP